MRRNISIFWSCLILTVLFLPIAYGHEEGAQAISRESLMGPIYAFFIITLAIILARFIKKSNVKQNTKGGKKHGRKK